MKIRLNRINLAILALILVVMGCSEETTDQGGTDTNETQANEIQAVNTGTMKFGYINTDSLSVHYKMIKDFEEEILQERLQMENQLQGMVRNLEKDYSDAQAGAAGLSDEALAILQQKLAQKEQQVMQQKNLMEDRLVRSEQEKTNVYLERVQEFLDAYAKAEGYDIIYGFNGLNNVLYINKGYDLSDVVIDSLNAMYESEKATAELTDGE